MRIKLFVLKKIISLIIVMSVMLVNLIPIEAATIPAWEKLLKNKVEQIDKM